MYRVIAVRTIGFVDATTTETIRWIGDTVAELQKQYPSSEIFGADPLGHHEIEDGWIRTDYRFESNLSGSWAEIVDPRPESGERELTNYERAIDEENRRRYPGDYMDDDVDCNVCGGEHDDCPYCH